MEKNNVVMLGVIFLSLYVNVAKIVLVQKWLLYNQLIKHILCTIITHSHFRNTQKQNFCELYFHRLQKASSFKNCHEISCFSEFYNFLV